MISTPSSNFAGWFENFRVDRRVVDAVAACVIEFNSFDVEATASMHDRMKVILSSPALEEVFHPAISSLAGGGLPVCRSAADVLRTPSDVHLRPQTALVRYERTRVNHVRSRVTLKGHVMENALLTPDEAGAQLGLSTGALAQLRYTGGGPCFIKLTAKAVRYRQCDLDAWVAAKARTSTRS